MNRFFCTLCALAALARAGTETSRLLDQAEHLILNCHLDRTYLDSAAGLIAAVRAVDPDNQRSLYLSTRLKIQQADFAVGRSERKDLSHAAQVTAESLKSLDDEDPRGICGMRHRARQARTAQGHLELTDDAADPEARIQ